jgi:hypothetical protein
MQRLFRRFPAAWPVLCLALVFIGSAALRAQNAPATASTQPTVTALDGNLELGDDIKATVDGLETWAATHDATKLVPFINGRAIRGNYPVEVHASHGTLHFELHLTPDNHDVWKDQLGAPTGLRKQVEFSVGPEGETPFHTELKGRRGPWLTVVSPPYGIVALVFVVVISIAFILLARRTELLRDSGPRLGAGRLRPYNLGRVQMAFWFFLTFIAYIVIWLITDGIDTITPSLLALMGISAGTALSEVLIDQNKDSAAASRNTQAAAEKQALETSTATLQQQINDLTASGTSAVESAAARDGLNRQLLEQRTRLNQLTQQLSSTAATAARDNVTQGFLCDILSDGDGYSFHRFQIFAWTIILGGVFVSAVYNSLTMPEFSATMLGLMGMSSGTYVGFKFPEKR